MRVGQARRRDGKEAEIVETLRAHDIEVWPLNDPGLPDLLCWSWIFGFVALLEIKADKGRLTAAQRRYTGPRWIVRTPAEALAVFGIQA